MFNSPIKFICVILALGLSCAHAQTYKDASNTIAPAVVPLVGCSAGGSCTGPVSLTSPLPVVQPGQRLFEAQVAITRPANTTAYAAGQVLSTATSGLTAFPTFALGIGNSTRFMIQNIQVISSNGTASTKGQFTIYLFNTASPSGGGFNDAATFAPTAAALSASGNALLGFVSSTLPNVGSASYAYQTIASTYMGLTDSSGNMYMAIVLNNAYTPASGETITIKIQGVY